MASEPRVGNTRNQTEMNEELLEMLRPFAKMVAEELVKVMPQPATPSEQYSGIAAIFKCGRTKAQAMKNSGVLDSAITSTGKKFIVDKQKALAAMQEKNRKLHKYN